ncbi:unnamed protein product, partial [Amaranthus hypochondriacus]
MTLNNLLLFFVAMFVTFVIGLKKNLLPPPSLLKRRNPKSWNRSFLKRTRQRETPQTSSHIWKLVQVLSSSEDYHLDGETVDFTTFIDFGFSCSYVFDMIEYNEMFLVSMNYGFS